MQDLFVLCPIRPRIDWLVGNGPLRDALVDDEVQVDADQRKDSSRDEEHVDDVDVRQRLAVDLWPCRKELCCKWSDEWRSCRLGDRHGQPPVGVLIPAQHLTGKGHDQCREQQEHAGHPLQLARVLVRAR